VDKQEQQQQQQEQEQESFPIISTDESFFFHDSLVRKVWIDKNKRPIIRVTGSHQHSCIFGAISIDGKQLFRQYDKFNGDTFLDYLKKIHAKFKKCYLFMDKASPHYKSKKVKAYFEDNKDTLIPIYLPTASPEFMVIEEVWNIAKRDLLVLKYYSSFADLKNKISKYFRTKRFNLNMRNYLLRDV
jgi:transposase